MVRSPVSAAISVMARMKDPQVKSPLVGAPSTTGWGGSRVCTAATCAAISFCKKAVAEAVNCALETVGAGRLGLGGGPAGRGQAVATNTRAAARATGASERGRVDRGRMEGGMIAPAPREGEPSVAG
jgi:hypothetical protein